MYGGYGVTVDRVRECGAYTASSAVSTGGVVSAAGSAALSATPR